MRKLIWSGVVVAGLVGCTGQTGPDSNVGVFETPERAMASRREKLLADWKDMAAKIANAERPDVRTIKAAQGFALEMSADGVQRTVYLTPLSDKLISAAGKEREPIRAFLAQKFPELDRARLKAVGFERAKAMLYPYLANTKQTAQLAAGGSAAGGAGVAPSTTITNPVVIDLNWVPVIKWTGAAGAQTPVDADVAAAWNVSAAQVSAAAIENLRATMRGMTQAPFDTVDLPGLGRYGTLRSGVDPAVLLMPEFVAAVRKEWKTTDDVLLFMPSRTTINFLERKNERLLNRMIPEWTRLYGKAAEPMISTMVLAGDGGLSLFSYAPPSTKPATAPATKPRVYIVQ